MKNKACLCLLGLVLVSGCAPQSSSSFSISSQPQPTCKNKIIILAGQSNMVGYTKYDELAEESWFSSYLSGADNVKIVSNCENRYLNMEFNPVEFGFGRTNSHFGPEVGIAHTLMSDAQSNYFLVKVAWGGTGLVEDEWQSESSGDVGKMYERLLEEVDNAVDLLRIDFGVTDYEIAALCWMQGEDDASNLSKSIMYEECMTNFVNDVRKNFKSENMLIADALIARTHTYSDRINTTKRNLGKTIKNYAVVDTISEKLMTNPLDIYHFDQKSELRLGEMFGEALLSR